MRENIEKGFGQWGRFAYRFAWPIIIVMTLFLGGLFSFLDELQLDTTMEAFFYEDNPARVRYNEFRKQYGRDDKVLIAIESDNVFDEEFLRKLEALHYALEEKVPFVNEVESLINARLTLGTEDGLVVRDLFEEWPETEAEMAELKKLVMSNPVYVDNFVSRDGTLAVILVENENFKHVESADNDLSGFDDDESEQEVVYLEDDDNTLILEGFNDTVAEFQADDFNILISSGPYTTAWFMDTVKASMTKFTGLAILAVATFLFIIFRRIVMVFLPLTVAILSMLAAMATMSALEMRLSFSMQIVPSFLIAVGVGNSVHIFTVFFQAVNRGENKEDALAYAMQHSGLAIMMTGFTTAGSLLSFLSSNMKPVAEFGTITPIGVMYALFFSLILLPALISVFPIRIKANPERNNSPVRDFLVSCGDFSYRHPKKVLFAWLILIGSGLYFGSKLQFSFFIYNNLPPDHPLIEATRLMDEKMSGVGPLELIIDSGKADGIKDPDFLNRVEKIYALIDDYSFHKVISIVDINKELHQALNENRPEFYAIPQDKILVSQELLLFENSGADDLEKMVDSQFRYARVTLMGPMQDAVIFNPIMREFIAEVQEILGDKYTVNSTGIMDLSFNIFTEMHVSLATTYLIAFVVITPLMIILIGSVRVGLVSMLPNLAPIIITLGIMNLCGINLTAATMLTGSIAIGLVVDDTIHFMHNFQRYFARSGDIADAIHKTLETTGQAIFFTTLVLTTAFMIFIMNEVTEWADFGFVTGLCISLALLADIFLAPALVTLLFKNQQKVKPLAQ